jgi:hypothetical protein
MTGNEFNAEYKLGQRIASGNVESYLAHVTATRRLVMVHRLGGASDGERRRINSLVDALPTRSTTVLARADVDGEPVIVTEFLPDFANFRDWLEAAVAVQTTIVIRTGPASPPPPPPSATPAPSQAGGEFTRLFGQPLAPSAPTPPPVPPVAASQQSAGPATGSFTQMFGAAPAPAEPPASSPPATPPAASPPPAPPASGPPRPGSFTQMFGAAAPPTDAPPNLSAPPAPVAPAAGLIDGGPAANDGGPGGAANGGDDGVADGEENVGETSSGGAGGDGCIAPVALVGPPAGGPGGVSRDFHITRIFGGVSPLAGGGCGGVYRGASGGGGCGTAWREGANAGGAIGSTGGGAAAPHNRV